MIFVIEVLLLPFPFQCRYEVLRVMYCNIFMLCVFEFCQAILAFVSELLGMITQCVYVSVHQKIWTWFNNTSLGLILCNIIHSIFCILPGSLCIL